MGKNSSKIDQDTAKTVKRKRASKLIRSQSTGAMTFKIYEVKMWLFCAQMDPKQL